ncbi:MAG: 5'-3' exonuclease H3TH domain-containing protein [Candidatus Paceibacterota bacterium]|jgi:DNA polymerase-1
MIADKKTLVIFDSNAIIHRAYHALPPLTNKSGEQTGAAYGFLLAFFKTLNDFNPSYLAACFDFPAPSFRREISKDYKANRPKADPELYAQIPLVKKILTALGVKVFEKQGFEADDLIGTIARASSAGSGSHIESIILSGDHDVLQLIDSHTSVCLLRKGVKDTALFDAKAVIEKYGIEPIQLIDYKALRGDPTDNISGIKGIGPKTATELLQKFQNLDRVYQEIEEGLKGGKISLKMREMLLSQKGECLTSRVLGKIVTDVPIGFDLEDCQWHDLDKEKIAKTLENFEFFSLAKRIRVGDKIEKPKDPPPSFKKNLKLW